MPVRSRRPRISSGVASSFAADLQQVGGGNRIPVAPGTIEKTDGIEGFDCTVDAGFKGTSCGSFRRSGRSQRTRRQLGTEHRMRTQDETGREFRAAEAPCRLAEAGSCEIEQAETFEERRGRHRRVQAGDEAFGGVQFCQRCPLVPTERRLTFAAC